VHFLLSLLSAAVAFAHPAKLEAQVLRGRIISSESRSPIADATVEAIDSLRRVIVSSRTDSLGAFLMRFQGDGEFRIRVRRIGIEPTLTDPLRFAGRDTVDLDLLVDERPAVLEEQRVTSTRSAFIEERLQNARSRGWRLFPPERVAPMRERAVSLDQLLRSLGMANVQISQQCIRSLVTNGCMAIFIDDFFYGPFNFMTINVRDIEFIAVIGPSEAITTYGNRAQNGIVMLYTARSEDRRQPRRP
jgi:hypothetical protein